MLEMGKAVVQELQICRPESVLLWWSIQCYHCIKSYIKKKNRKKAAHGQTVQYPQTFSVILRLLLS